MDFDLSKPQKMLQSSVHEFLSRHCPVSKVRELMATATAFDPELWEGMADQGWTGLTIPEEWGGLGLGAVELAVVAEAMGQHCLPGPFISNQCAAATIVASGHQDQCAEYLEAIADGQVRGTLAQLEENVRWHAGISDIDVVPTGNRIGIKGSKFYVPDADTADFQIWTVLGDDNIGGIVAITIPHATPGMTITPMPAIDQTRKIYRVDLDTEVADDRLLARGGFTIEAVEAGVREAIVALCAEMVGGMQWMMDTTVEYAKTREQFGRPIGSFQAVQHHCANMLLYLESARSATYYAAWAVAEKDPEAAQLVSIAKAYTSDAARELANLAIQVHGGIGFTWEHDLQLYYKRAKSSEILFGDANYHREELAFKIIDCA